MKKFSVTFFSAVLILSISFGCTSKRNQIFSQGQGTNLDTISSWKDLTVAISTGEVIGKSTASRAEENIRIKDKVMNHFDLVQIKVENQKIAALVGNPPFRGRPNVQGVYELRVKLTDHYLKFYKVAKPDDLPFDEHAYQEEQLPDGRIAIPMVGYRVNGYFHIEAVKTSDDQDSHHLTEIADEDISKSTHVRIDWSSRESFQPIKTTDLMPASILFNQNNKNRPYEWYFAETVIEKSMSDSQTIIGENSARNENSQLVPASKIMFVPRENELRVVNVARDERLSRDQIKNSADLNSEAAMIIPVKWFEYRTRNEGVALGMQGEVIEDRQWNQRKYFELNIPELKSTAITEGTTRLLSIEVDQNYLGFTVLNMIGNQGRKIHYSFLRADAGRSPYQPRRSFKSDRGVFGFFTSEKPFIANWEYYTEEDFNKRVFMSRMNPALGEIVFHLSAGSPAWLEDIAEKAVEAWNRSFEKALEGSGKTIQVKFSKDRVVLGDLRYNVIHLVETLSEDGLLGFGPSVADPETGEIISATTNVYVNSTQAIAASTVRNYMIDRLENRINAEATGETILSEVTDQSGKMGFAAKRVGDLVSSFEKNGKIPEQFKMDSEAIIRDLKEISKNRCEFSQQVALGSNDRDIQKHCPEIERVLQGFKGIDLVSRANSKANWEKVWSESKEAIQQCSVKITRGKLLSTLIHELGHNLGLRHNFYGSYDKNNFPKVTTIFGDPIVAHSSSIMEYTDWDEDRLTETGPYDIAAIRFGYGEQVELKDGSLVAVDVSKPLDSNTLKTYLFCTDEEAYTGLNAVCKPHDAGTTPMELVDFYINDFKRNESIRKLRRARPFSNNQKAIAYSNLERNFIPLKDIYDQWRYQLGEYVKKSARYLNDYGSKSYAQVLESMSKDPQFGPIYSQYKEAADRIYEFFKEISFGPNQYCLIEDLGEKRAMEFERLRDMLFESSRGLVAIRNCADAANAADLAKVLGATAPTVLLEIGNPVNSYRFEKAEKLSDYLVQDSNGNQRERFDVVGNQMTRIFAGLMIHHRMENAKNSLSDFAPNMTDEPNHYQDYLNVLLNRLVNGVDLSNYGLDEIQPLFTQESQILKSFTQFLKVGLYTPGETLNSINKVATGRKLYPLSVYRLSQSDDPSKFASVLSMNDRNLFAAIRKEHAFAYHLINKFNEINTSLSLKSVDSNIIDQLHQGLVALMPSKSELNTSKVIQLAKVEQLLVQLQDQFPILASCVFKKLPVLEQTFGLLEAFIQDYQQAEQSGPSQLKAFLGSGLMEYLNTKLEGQEILFSRENMKELSPSLLVCSNEQNDSFKKINQVRKDLESQKSLILDVLNDYAD
jgi:hypothetical protein